MKKLAIFDLDGTLLNTIADLGMATNHAMESMGFPTYPIDDYRFMVGNGITRLIERALPADHRDEATIIEARRHFLDYYDRHLTDHTRPYPGIPELLEWLSARNVMVAVASNKYHAAVERLIARYFPTIKWTAVEGHREGRPTKPSPLIVEDIMAMAGVTRDEVLYLGDSGVDIDTARNAGVDAMGVAWGFRPESELLEHGAERVAHSTDDIINYISAQ